MPKDSPQDSNRDDRDRNYYRGLIRQGLDVDAMSEITGDSRATIYRKFGRWKWKRGWVETEPVDHAPPAAAANYTTALPAPASDSPPTTQPGDLLTPEIRAKVEALKKQRRRP